MKDSDKKNSLLLPHSNCLSYQIILEQKISNCTISFRLCSNQNYRREETYCGKCYIKLNIEFLQPSQIIQNNVFSHVSALFSCCLFGKNTKDSTYSLELLPLVEKNGNI